MPSAFHDTREKFRRSGYVLTSPRRGVLEALEAAKGHPSKDDVYLMITNTTLIVEGICRVGKKDRARA